MKQSRRAIEIGAVDKIRRAEPVSLSPKGKRNEYIFIVSCVIGQQRSLL